MAPPKKRRTQPRQPRKAVGRALGAAAERAIGMLGTLAGLGRSEVSDVLVLAGGDALTARASDELTEIIGPWMEQDPRRVVEAIRKPLALAQMRTQRDQGGRPMDASVEVRLNDGRRVGISAFRVSGSYAGLIEGPPGQYVDQFKQSAISQIRRDWGERPTHVFEPTLVPMRDGSGRLPAWACAAQLDSTPASEDRMGSHLVVLWWQERLAGSIPTMVQVQIRALDWNALAVDYDL